MGDTPVNLNLNPDLAATVEKLGSSTAIRRDIGKQCVLYESKLQDLLDADKNCRGKFRILHFGGEMKSFVMLNGVSLRSWLTD